MTTVEIRHPGDGMTTFLTDDYPQMWPDMLDAATLDAAMNDLWQIAGDPSVLYMSARTANLYRKALQTYASSVIDRRFAGVRRRQDRKQNRRRN